VAEEYDELAGNAFIVFDFLLVGRCGNYFRGGEFDSIHLRDGVRG